MKIRKKTIYSLIKNIPYLSQGSYGFGCLEKFKSQSFSKKTTEPFGCFGKEHWGQKLGTHKGNKGYTHSC
jgi:hypothetical protein